MVKCENCDKRIIFKKKYYEYPGNKKGSFEITEHKTYCKKCFDELFHSSNENTEDTGKLIILMHEEKFKEALQDINKNFNKRYKCDWYNKGNIYYNLKKDQEAIKCYDEAIYLDTHYIKAWYKKGMALFELDEFDKATKCFTNVLELEKNYINEDSILVHHSEKGFRYETNVWTFASLLMRALSFMQEKKFDEADETFTLIYRVVKHLPPFNSIEQDKFIEFCVKNSVEIVGWFTPNVVASFSSMGNKH